MAPKANIMRTEDDATAAAAYLSGQAELFATNNLIIPDLQKRNPSKEFEIKFVIRRSPAHMGVRMSEMTIWCAELDSFIFFNTMRTASSDRLHQKMARHADAALNAVTPLGAGGSSPTSP